MSPQKTTTLINQDASFSRNFYDSERINYLRLSRAKNLRNIDFFALINKFQNATNTIRNLDQYLQYKNLKKPIILASEIEILDEIKKCDKIGAKIIAFYDESYPKLLKEIADPPPIITIKGNIKLLQQNIIAIIGTRNASINGCRFTRKIASDLGKENITIISGLARGIDTAAHQASLDSGTIAVIAGGIDNIYPSENKSLYEEIFEKGIVITEQKIGEPPKAFNFIKRNRIISGLALGVVVIEAKLKSGSLTTARFALEQNREIFAVPGSPFDPRYQGTNLLIKQGAKLTENQEDIISEIRNLSNFNQKSDLLDILPKSNNTKIEISNEKIEDEIGVNICSGDTNIQSKILKRINYSPILVEDIVDEFKVSASLVNIAIIEMEINGVITVIGDKIYLN